LSGGVGGCQDTSLAIHITAPDGAAGSVGSGASAGPDAICLELDADGTERFGRRYELASYPLPQSLTALPGDKSAVEALVYGLRQGLPTSRSRKVVNVRPGVVTDVSLPLGACKKAASAPSGIFKRAGAPLPGSVDRAIIVPTPASGAAAGGMQVVALSAGRVLRASATSGGLTALAAGAPIPSAHAILQLLAVDVNQDCGHDLILAQDKFQPSVWTRTEAGEYVTDAATLPVPPDSLRASGLAVGDVDGDGYADLLTVGDTGASLFVSDRQGGFLSPTEPFSELPTAPTAVVLGDIDGDGDVDAIVGSATAPLAAYLNGGPATGVPTLALTPNLLPPDADNVTTMALVDVDADRDLDLIVVSNGGPVRLYLNQGGTFNYAPATALPDQMHYSIPTLLVRDLDGDCAPDLLFARAGNEPQIWYNDGSGVFKDRMSTLTIRNDPMSSVTGAAAEDVDGDGLVDLVFFGSEGLSLWLQQ
jgi:hypothetical protein